MPTEKGSKTSFVMYEETSYGVAPTTPNGLQLPVVEASLAMKRAINRSRVLRGDRNQTPGSQGRKDLTGPLVIQPGVRDLAFVLKHAHNNAPTVAGVGPYTHTIKVGALPIGITLDKKFATLTQVFRYLGLRINSYTFAVNDDGLLEMSIETIGADLVQDTALLDAGPKLYAIQGFAIPSLTIQEGGAPLTIGKDFQLTVSNNLDVETGRVMGNGGKVADLPEGLCTVDFSMTVLFQSLSLYNKALNHTESSIMLNFPAPSAGHSAQFDLKEVEYEFADVPVRGPNGITVPMSGHAYFDDDAGASAITWTIINDVASLASIPA